MEIPGLREVHVYIVDAESGVNKVVLRLRAHIYMLRGKFVVDNE
jgi:hypothetical protein